MEVKGINFRSNSKGEIYEAFHRDTFRQYMETLPVNDAGYFTLKLIPNDPQRQPKFSHHAIHCKDRTSGQNGQ